MTIETIRVAIAVIERDGRFLVTQRAGDAEHLPGLWEFPGGKCEPGESAEVCIRREVREELGLNWTVTGYWGHVSHTYDDRVIELEVFTGTVQGSVSTQPARQGRQVRWVSRSALSSLDMPIANRSLIASLQRQHRDIQSTSTHTKGVTT